MLEITLLELERRGCLITASVSVLWERSETAPGFQVGVTVVEIMDSTLL